MKKVLLLLVLLTVQLSYSQTQLGFELDYARFNYDSTSVFMEFYYELSPANMQKKTSAGATASEAIVHIEILNTDTKEFFLNKNYKIVNDVVDSLPKNLSGVLGFVIPKGNYSLSVKAYDLNNPKLEKVINENFAVQPFRTDKFSMSDIELATRIKKDAKDTKSIFYKNTLEVFPNASMLYTEQSPVLFFYAELYNLKLEDPAVNFVLKKDLVNSAGVMVQRSEKQIKQGAYSVVEVGLVNLSKLPSDSYNLALSLIDPKTNQAFISTKRFYLYNPNVIDSAKNVLGNLNVMNSEFGIFSVEDCDLMFKQVKYIASRTEIDRYGKLDSLNAKREFLFNFWNARNPEPGSSRNEYKEQFMKRVAYANQHFKSMGREGYLTDRGRVLLLYGEPDQKDMFPNEPNLKPYEVWFYHEIEGGVTFYFADLTGFGKYDLLHSNKRGEIEDEDWQSRIMTE
ncbi:MAG: GWxTD domain-containing protein [Bacteroidota bacterium]